MLTHAPLFRWRELRRALTGRSCNDDQLSRPWRRNDEVAGWLSRSAWSLALVAVWRKKLVPKETLTVWLPEFLCADPLAALRCMGVTPVFYPVTEQMEPDFAACQKLATVAPPGLFVMVHYFGQPARAVRARDFCLHCGAWLVEDATHVLRPTEGIGDQGDFVLYSPHKHLPIPDGAVLVLRPKGPAGFTAASLAAFGNPCEWQAELRARLHRLGLSPTTSSRRAGVWLLKRLVQKAGLYRGGRGTTIFAEGTTSDLSPTPLVAPELSSLSQRFLSRARFDLPAVARHRQRNQLMWDALLLNHQKLALQSAARPVGREWTPYLASYRGSPPDVAAAFEHLVRNGLPATTWPNLPPEVTANREADARAWRLRHGRLYLPTHQSVSVSDGLKWHKYLPMVGRTTVGIRLEWDQTGPKQWLQFLAVGGRTNFLQSWAYGAAKSVTAGWRPRRGVFYLGGEPIACVQILQKRFAGFLAVTRLNRGPVRLRTLTDHEERAIWKELGRLGSIGRGRMLICAPEITLSGSNLLLMAELGFRQLAHPGYESVWVNLGLETVVLRSQMQGKWRNMLSAAEKSALTLESGSDDALFGWMIDRYEELMRENKFRGPPSRLLQAVRMHDLGVNQLVVLRANLENEPVAGICVALHGSAATYLLGWNSPRGRALKANQYLLWRAILQLKQSGFQWFDLGGIDEEHTPGVSAFKLGLGGERYELVGEYIKI